MVSDAITFIDLTLQVKQLSPICNVRRFPSSGAILRGKPINSTLYALLRIKNQTMVPDAAYHINLFINWDTAYISGSFYQLTLQAYMLSNPGAIYDHFGQQVTQLTKLADRVCVNGI